MKRIFAIILCLVLAGFSYGCQNTKSHATEGAVIGGLLGATAGGIIGHQGHHGAEGAGIGAAVGALAGGLIGAQMPKDTVQSDAQPAQSTQTVANPNQMSTQQIIDLSKQNVNEAVIIDKIKLTNSRFNLTEVDAQYLKEQGVSQKVIDVMQGKG